MILMVSVGTRSEKDVFRREASKFDHAEIFIDNFRREARIPWLQLFVGEHGIT